MEKVHVLFMLFGPEVILTSSVYIPLAGSRHTVSTVAKRDDAKYCPVTIQQYVKGSLNFSG